MTYDELRETEPAPGVATPPDQHDHEWLDISTVSRIQAFCLTCGARKFPEERSKP